MISWPALSSVLPCSWVSIRASPSGGCCNAAAHSFSTLRRVAISLLHDGNACAAAFIAWSSSALVQSGTSANTLPVARLITPVVFDPFTAFPSIVIVCPGILRLLGVRDDECGSLSIFNYKACALCATAKCLALVGSGAWGSGELPFTRRAWARDDLSRWERRKIRTERKGGERAISTIGCGFGTAPIYR